jgi:dipeptidyl aminopeptidase/acylaminoacyl peptidase
MRDSWRTAIRACKCTHAFFTPAPVLVAMALCVPLTDRAISAERPLTVDDVLKLSNVGKAAVRPGTEAFVWEQSPPYDTLGDYGAGITATWWGSNYEIWTVGSNSPMPKRLFEAHHRTTYVLGGFSGDGRFLTLLATRDGKVRLAAYDFRRQRLTEFPVTPRFPFVTAPDCAWLDNRHLAIAAYTRQDGPRQFAFRRALGDRLTASWAKSWKGKEPSVDQYDSSAIDANRPLPGRLVVLDLVSGHIQQLSSGQFSGLHPSPDGRWLAAVRQSMLPQATLENPNLDWTIAQSTLTLFSLSGKLSAQKITPELDVLPDSVEWNPSSSKFAFFASRTGVGKRNGDYWIFNPSNSAVKVEPHMGLSLASQRAHGGANFPERAFWFKDSLAVFAHPTPGQPGTLAFEDIKLNGVVDSRVAVASIPPHWFLLESSLTPRDLTPGMQEVSPVPVFSNGSQFLVVGDGRVLQLDALGSPLRLFPEFSQRLGSHANEDMLRETTIGGEGFLPVSGAPGKLARIGMENGSPSLKLLTTPPGTSVLAVAKSGTALAQVGSGKGAILALLHPSGDLKMLRKLNPFLDQIVETRWIDFGYSNAEGSNRAELSGCLLLPPNYHAGQIHPLVVEVYPDRPGGCGTLEVRDRYAMAARPTAYSEHLLAARGFIVFRPDTGGGISRTPDGPQAGLAAVVDRGVDAVLAAGYGDPTRVGLMGVSQGGFVSLWLATQSQRYQAIVSLNGWSDLANEFFEMNWERELVPADMPSNGGSSRYLSPAGTDFYMEGTPWKLPQRYVANSPLWHSDAVSTPVLLIHSDMDSFDDANYKSFFTSLYIQKKDARLLIYRGEGHTPSSPANIRHMWQSIFSWFDKYLRVNRDSDGTMILGE